jgi:histidinol-phosphatase (PHP family)
MYADYHMHTSFSDDSDYPMEDCVYHAIALGLEEICFTEHTDFGTKDAETNCDTAAYFKELQRCQKKFADKIRIKFGMEFGMQVTTIREFQQLFASYPFDFIILSCHQVDNLFFFIQQFQKGRTQQEYNERYYEEILKVMQGYDDFSILGHLDMIKRYDKCGEYPFAGVRDIIAEILRLVIQKGKGIEVNTSCFRYKLPDLTPSHEILELYRDLGGDIITIGSDSHMRAHVGCRIKEVQEELSNIGFKNIYTFEKMKPVGHKLYERIQTGKSNIIL